MRWHLKGQPWEVQQEAVRRSRDEPHFFYAMEPRLGKTPVSLNRYVEQAIADRINGCVITCPNHLIYNWKTEIEAWMASPPRLTLWPDEPTDKTDVFIVNWQAWYNTRPHNIIRDFMRRRGKGRVAAKFDESQWMKTYNSNTAKNVIGTLSEFEPWVDLLSGTPVTQSVMDWWPQLRAVGLLVGTNPINFRNRYAVMGGFKGKKVTGFKNEEELFQIMNRRVFRALTADWRKDLPSQTWGIISYQMTPRQRKLYQEMYEDFLIVLNDVEVSAEMIVSQLIKLQQIGRGFVKNGDSILPIFDKPEDNPSLMSLKAAVEEEQGKTLIFAVHRHTCHELFEGFKKWGFDPALIVGGMAPEDTHREKNRFNNDPGCRINIAQISLGKEGHDFTGDQSNRKNACAYTLYYENTYNLGDRMQSEKRNHGPLQKFPVRYGDFVGSPMDAKVVRHMGEKKESVSVIADTIRATPRV